jgi:hypothetical protein
MTSSPSCTLYALPWHTRGPSRLSLNAFLQNTGLADLRPVPQLTGSEAPIPARHPPRPDGPLYREIPRLGLTPNWKWEGKAWVSPFSNNRKTLLSSRSNSGSRLLQIIPRISSKLKVKTSNCSNCVLAPYDSLLRLAGTEWTSAPYNVCGRGSLGNGIYG